MVRRISKSEIGGALEQWHVGSLIKFVTQRVYAEQLIQGIPYLQAIDEFRSKEAGDGRSDAYEGLLTSFMSVGSSCAIYCMTALEDSNYQFFLQSKGAGPAGGQPGAGSATDPALKPATATPKTITTTKTTVNRTTVSTPSKAKAAGAATATLPKTADSNWIAASLALFLLGAALIAAAHRRSVSHASSWRLFPL